LTSIILEQSQNPRALRVWYGMVQNLFLASQYTVYTRSSFCVI